MVNFALMDERLAALDTKVEQLLAILKPKEKPKKEKHK